MAGINYRELRSLVEHKGVDGACTHLSEAMSPDAGSGRIRPEDFSIRSLFEELVTNGSGSVVGPDVLRECFDMRGPRKNLSILEAAGAVSTTAFSNITGQIFYNKFLEGYQQEAFVVTSLIPTVSTMLSGEKMPGITGIGDQATVVAEGQSFPLAGVGEDYVETPQTLKRGLIVPVTKEAVFFDRTGQLLQRASAVGEAVGIAKEKRAINCLIDQNSTAHRYKWRGTTYATYQTSSPWINKKTSNGLVDWTNIDAAEQLLANMTDPNTGEPIAVKADTIVVTPQKYQAAVMALRANGVTINQGGYATSGTLMATATVNPVGGGPYSGTYKIVSSRFIPPQLATDTDWFLCNPARAFACMENWPIQVKMAPPNSEQEFNNDIVYRYRADERSAYATIEPRLAVWNVA